MGQGPSASANGDSKEDDQVKTDYYDLLGVERQASEEEIKKAYRRKALELHPDRNYGNAEDATRLFAEIQSAYEVLSDPQERAWYDSHRDVLLRGDQGGAAGSEEFSYNIRMTTADQVLKLMMKFNRRADYSDSPSGFYGGLQEFFGQLAREEQIACQWEDQEPVDYPHFGHKEDDYEDVVRPFYAAWNGFVTKKSYSWKDQYRLSDASDRRIRRLMEKENKKIREEAIREYNDAVRSLVAFVRKRDPRFQENQKSEAERQKILRDAAAANAARSRAARQAKLEELDGATIPEWAQSRAADEYEGGFTSESEAEEHEYECVVCDKMFKSEAQFQAHERSKKHIKSVKQLKREMRNEGAELGPGTENDVEAETEVRQTDQQDQNVRLGREGQSASTKHRNSIKSLSDQEIITENGQVESTKEDDEFSAPSEDDYAPRSEVLRSAPEGTASDLPQRLRATNLEDLPASSDTEASGPLKVGKAKAKRAKKAAQNGASSTNKTDQEFICAVCQSGFPSKTRLFNHIKDEGHAAPVVQVRGEAGKGKKGKKR